MSLSSLEAQLAAIQKGSGGAAAGSFIPASKRHEDAVGRGLTHSVQTGQATFTKATASILFPDATSASDVPVQVLQEECEAAWHALTTDFAPPSNLLGIWSILEQATPKQQVKLIKSVTVYLSSCLGEDDATAQQRCLSVAEFLLRRYQVHLTAPVAWIWMWLPHSATMGALWHRALQLVDLATSAGQAYIWLRPYAMASQTAVPPLSLVARHVLQNQGILRAVCQWTTDVAGMHVADDDTESIFPRAGVARLLSYSAACVVQGLSYLSTTSDPSLKQEQHWPAVVRILLPATVTCVQSSVADVSAWGHVVSSVLAETCPLAPQTVSVLVVPMLQAGQAAVDVVTAADSVAAALSVLLPPHVTTVPPKQSSDGESMAETFLRLTNDKWLGCPLPAQVLQTAFQWDSVELAAALGHLHTDRKVYVAPLVVALVVAALASEQGELVVDLISEPALKTMYADPRLDLVASVSAEIVRMALRQNKDDEDKMDVDGEENVNDDSFLELGRNVLKALHATDTAACERGMADAIQHDPLTTQQKERLTLLLEGIIAPATGKSSQQAEGSVEQLLPPRVALEHAEPAVRLQAVERLVASMSEMDHEASGGDSESLVESLLRRWSMDDDAKVALAASTAVCDAWSSGQVSEDNYSNFAELTLSGSYRWIHSSSTNSDLSEKSVMLAALVAKGVAQVSSKDSAILWQLLVEVVAAQLDQTNEASNENAAKALLVALHSGKKKTASSMSPKKLKKLTGSERALLEAMDAQKSPKKKGASVVPLAQESLASCESLIKGVLACYSQVKGINGSAEMAMRGRCLWVLLSSISKHFTQECKASEYDTIGLCLLVLDSADSVRFDNSKCDLLKACLDQSTQQVLQNGEEVPGVIALLASIGPDAAFEKVALPVIRQLSEKLSTKGGAPVSPLVVLLEVALRLEMSTVAVERLLSLASDVVSSTEKSNVGLAIVPALSLLEATDERVRKASVNLLQSVEATLNKNPDENSKPLLEVCQSIAKHKSSATMGGTSFLSTFLSACVKDSRDAPTLRDVLMKLCVLSALSCSGDAKTPVSKISKSRWLSLGHASGGCQAATVLLHAFDFSGEDSFPLSLRWKLTGQPLADAIIAEEVPEEDISTAFRALAESVVKMLKGVTISDPRIIISSGPRSGGGRVRSYSVGKFDGVRVIDPYPKEMHTTIVDVLTLQNDTAGTRVLASFIARDVLSSKSWGEGIYQSLSRPVRKRLASAILSYVGGDIADPPEGVFVGLPFDCIDISELLGKDERGAGELASASMLADFIRSNTARLLSSTGVNVLVAQLFDLLTKLSAKKSADSDGVDFTCQSILLALSQMLGGVDGTGIEIKVEKKKLAEWVNLLLALLGGPTDKSIRALPTYRSRSAVLTLLARLSQTYPERVVGSLLPALSACISTLETHGSSAMNIKDAFSILVPVYCSKAASAGLSVANLLGSFIDAVKLMPDDDVRASIFQALINVLGAEQDAAPGGVVAAFLAGQVFASGDKAGLSESVASAVQILSYCPAPMQAASLLLLLRYSKSFLLRLQGEVSTLETGVLSLPTPSQIATIALKGPATAFSGRQVSDDEKSTETLTVLTKALFQTFNEALLLESVRRFVKRSDGLASSLSLRLWQDLLVVQSSAQSMTSDDTMTDEANLWESATGALNESREYLQDLLPAHIFLASVTSLIKEGGTDEIRARALRLVADRAVEVDPQSPEAALFIDLIPDMVELLKPMSDKSDSRGVVLQQSVLIAIEHIARGLGVSRPASGRTAAAATAHFFKALERSSTLLLSHFKGVKVSTFSFAGPDSALCQLFCSIALCAATLIRATGARCLPVLPKMMGVFMSLLSSANAFVSSANGEETEPLAQARVLQLSMLRVFLAVAESVPQFLGSYLNALLVGLAALSKSVNDLPKEHSDPALKSAVERLEAALPSRVPSRLFLPAASRAIGKCSAPTEACTMLAMLKVSIEKSTSAEATSQKAIILQAVTKAYDFDGSSSEMSPLLGAANAVLVALILKLSEVQLRGLYMSLREWRGDFNKENPDKLAKRRYAFWTVSAALSKELRSIFLPCLSMVISDVVAELELAAVTLCQPRTAKKTADGNKKRRLASSNEVSSDFGPESFRTVEPLLRCLEHSLRADAHNGGNWVRSDENQRYTDLLEPLGKLLQSRIPVDASTEDSSASISFQSLIQGVTEDGGNVVSCLTALASAAGNEQLWKPLNHAVLEACGNESRSEVRLGGITCLLSLMKSLGEEYMVLLPECLPVLSELLEDSDEEICALAKESVTLAEETIGESLEGSLR